MSRQPERRSRPTVQVLEGRAVPSSLGVSSPVVAPAEVVVAPAQPAPGRVPGPGGPSGIIAILIG